LFVLLEHKSFFLSSQPLGLTPTDTTKTSDLVSYKSQYRETRQVRVSKIFLFILDKPSSHLVSKYLVVLVLFSSKSVFTGAVDCGGIKTAVTNASYE